MRGTRKLLATVIGCGVLLGIGVTSVPVGEAANAHVDALKAQRAQLVQQLAAVEPAKDSAASSLGQAESAFNGAQAQLLAAQNQLAALNARLLALSAQIASDEATIAKAKHQLSGLTRQSYETTSTDSWVAAVLSASTFNQAMDRLAGTSHVAEQVKNMQATVRDKEAAINAEKSEVATDAAKTTSLEATLATDSNALLVVVQQRNSMFETASGPARAIAAQIADIDQQIAAAEAPPPPADSGSGSCGNHFAYGQCTWYVASRRCIPWVGNARDWFYRAQEYGYPVGHSPAPGAVVVFWPGGDGASSVGHVGYVEAVGPADGIPAGHFKLSEMNFNGWNRVNYRVLPSDSGGIQGFIYAK